MQELTELRKRIEEQDYQAALAIIDELEEAAKKKPEYANSLNEQMAEGVPLSFQNWISKE